MQKWMQVKSLSRVKTKPWDWFVNLLLVLGSDESLSCNLILGINILDQDISNLNF